MPCNKNISRGCCFRRNQNNEPQVSALEGSQKMEIHDYLADIPNPLKANDIFEVQFKNTRKGFFQNSAGLSLKKGDIVVVEAAPGVDVGIITMSSDLVHRQMRCKGFNPEGCEFKKILRFPNILDIEKWQEAIALEHNTMIRSRQISAQMNLDMKIGDVEYQADKMKAIFYYIADGRVDFRELIKVFAEQFRVRIEMKQIGARQEAGRIGGIAACGRELCCSTWQNNFSSVSINAARVQDITPNPQKLAGQCGKLKCCLNYEMDSYIDARNSLPRVNNPLETLEANYFLVKTDPLRGLMYFSSDPKNLALQIPLTSDKVRIIMSMNRKGQKVESLQQFTAATPVVEEPAFENVVGQDSLTRFDKSKNNNRRRGNRNSNNANNNGAGNVADEGQPRGERPQRNERKATNNSGENQSDNRNENRENRGENRENRGENRGENPNRRPNNNRRRNNNRSQNGGNRNNGNNNNPQGQNNGNNNE